jgi:hypothetical protein
MAFRKGKRAAIELSTNALVVVIISMISIALIIVFLNSITTNTDRLIDERMQEAQRLIESMSCRDNKRICLTPEVLYLNRKTFFGREPMDTVYLIINNIYGERKTFRMKISPIPEGSECIRSFALYGPEDDFEVLAGGNARIPIIFLRDHDEEKCQVKVEVFIKEGNFQRYDSGIVYVYDRE